MTTRTGRAATAAVLTYAAAVSLWWSASGFLDHDEHQFMASAFMVWRYGLQPYRDFAYFQMPNLVYLYAPLFATPYPFILARIFVGICGLAICSMIFLYARSLTSNCDKMVSLFVPISTTVLLLHSPLYREAASHVWNHTPSTFFALLAFFLHCKAVRSEKPAKLFFFSGLSLGMALGIRLTFAPLIIPFLLAMVFCRAGTLKRKGLQVLAFGIGGLLANGAAIYFFFTSYQDFWFGNLGYAKLNTMYREAMSYAGAMTFPGKMKYLIDVVFAAPAELLVALAILCLLVLFVIDRIRKPGRPKFEMVFLLLSLPFLFFGSIAPTPSFTQYYFELIPFLLLLGLYALSSCRSKAFLRAAVLPLVLLSAVSFVYGSPLAYSRISAFTNPQFLLPVRLQRESDALKLLRGCIGQRGGEGKVLTLSPLFAVNAKLPIYSEFVTGPFAWRVSHLLSEKEALKRGLPLPSRIKSFVRDRRPCAILTGAEGERLERPLVMAARELGYQPVRRPSGLVVWLPAK